MPTKTLDSESESQNPEGKILTPEEAKEQSSTGQPPETEPSSYGDVLQERMRRNVIAGGVTDLPAIFGEREGDWQTIKSINPFTVLYLDDSLIETITMSTIERQYKVLRAFWNITLQQLNGPNSLLIINKFAGPDGSEITVRKYSDRLEEVFQQFNTKGVIEVYNIWRKQRLESAKQSLERLILGALADNSLEPSEENMIRNEARHSTDLTDQEIKSLIDDYLKSTGSVRSKGSGPRETEQLFNEIIQQKVKASKGTELLTKHDEAELKNLIGAFNISSERYEALVLQCLFECKGVEREETLEGDKNAFHDFYLGLLKRFGLSSKNKLVEAAQTIYDEQEQSLADFIPLKDQTRQSVISKTIKDYSKAFEKQKKEFMISCLKELEEYDGHADRVGILLTDQRYDYLPDTVRRSLLEEATAQTIESVRQVYVELGRELHFVKGWEVTEKEIEILRHAPESMKSVKKASYSWLTQASRDGCISELKLWAEATRSQEVSELNTWLTGYRKKFPYGMDKKTQDVVEKADDIHLTLAERRKVIGKVEELFRKKAAVAFREEVQKAICHDTILPPVEKDLIEKGEEHYLLTEWKNQVSFSVPTAKQIVSEIRKPFEDIVKGDVKTWRSARQLDPTVTKEFALKPGAYISLSEIENYVKSYKPGDDSQHELVHAEIRKHAKSVALQICDDSSEKEFDKLLQNAIEKRSGNYRLSFSKFADSKFLNSMIRVGGVYGISAGDVKLRIKKLSEDYHSWVTPRWNRLIYWPLGIMAVFAGFRAAMSLSGYSKWLFISGPVESIPLTKFVSFVNWGEALSISQKGWWGILFAVGIIVVAVVMIKD